MRARPLHQLVALNGPGRASGSGARPLPCGASPGSVWRIVHLTAGEMPFSRAARFDGCVDRGSGRGSRSRSRATERLTRRIGMCIERKTSPSTDSAMARALLQADVAVIAVPCVDRPESPSPRRARHRGHSGDRLRVTSFSRRPPTPMAPGIPPAVARIHHDRADRAADPSGSPEPRAPRFHPCAASSSTGRVLSRRRTRRSRSGAGWPARAGGACRSVAGRAPPGWSRRVFWPRRTPWSRPSSTAQPLGVAPPHPDPFQIQVETLGTIRLPGSPRSRRTSVFDRAARAPRRCGCSSG